MGSRVRGTRRVHEQRPVGLGRGARVRAARQRRVPRRHGARGPVPLRGQERWRVHRSEEHTSELQSRRDLVCRLLLEKKNFVVLNQENVLEAWVTDGTAAGTRSLQLEDALVPMVAGNNVYFFTSHRPPLGGLWKTNSSPSGNTMILESSPLNGAGVLNRTLFFGDGGDLWKLNNGTTPVKVSTLFFFTNTATTEIYTLSLHDALPI